MRHLVTFNGHLLGAILASMIFCGMAVAVPTVAAANLARLEDDPTREEFAEALIVELRQVAKKEFELNAERFELFESGNQKNVINLANVYDEHLGLEPEKRPGHIKQIARSLGTPQAALPDDFEKARANLRPKVWPRAMFEMAKLNARLRGSGGLDLPREPLGEHLFLTIVYDTPEAMRSISSQQLKDWKVTKEEAFKVAAENLEQTTKAFARIGDHLHSSVTGDSYDSSRVVLEKIKKFKVQGEHVVLLPNRNGLLVAGSEDEDSLTRMFDLSDADNNVRPLSPLPLILKDEQWVDWVPTKDHPIRPLYENRKRTFYSQLYAEQKRMLNKLFEEEANPVFVSGYSMASNPKTEATRSYSVWPKGLDSILPKTEIIYLCTKPGEIAAIGTWERVMEVAGDLIEEDDSYYPPRFRVKSFPNKEQLEKIGTLEY